MGAWGINQKSTRDAAAPLSQADPASASRSESATAKRWKISVALLAAGSLALVVGGNFHSWRKAAPLNLAGTTPVASKGEIGKFALIECLRERAGEFALDTLVMGEREQADHGSRCFADGLHGTERVPCAAIGWLRPERVAIA